MRVRVDREKCEGNAMCMGVAPDVFELSEDGKVKVLQDPLPDGLRATVADAVRACPTQALALDG